MLSLLIGATAFGQDDSDVLLFSLENYEGTARSMAMGNAFTALGGDIGGMAINPASSAVFRSSQIAITPSIDMVRSEASYLGGYDNASSSRFGLSNAGAVLSFDTSNYNGIVSYSFGFAHNRKNNFNSITRAKGSTSSSSYLASMASDLHTCGITYGDLENSNAFNNLSTYWWPAILAVQSGSGLFDLDKNQPFDDSAFVPATYNRNPITDQLYLGGPLNQELYRRSYGGVDEFTINFGGNVSDIFYFGINMNLESVRYTYEESVTEFSQDSKDFDTGFDQVISSYWRHTSGAGLNFKFGAIVSPVRGLRIGATFTTPTWYNMTDHWDNNLVTYFDGSDTYCKNVDRDSPEGVYDYKIKTPMRFSLGAAYVIGDKGVLSLDYERVDYSKINSSYCPANILRAGAEVRFASKFAVRGGYNYIGSPYKNVKAQQFYNVGLGFNINSHFGIDVAYRGMFKHDNQIGFYDSYNGISAPTGTETEKGGKLAFTLSFKF